MDRFLNFGEINYELALSHNYTVIDAFDSTNGKFGNTLGNVALVDCKTFQNVFMTTY